MRLFPFKNKDHWIKYSFPEDNFEVMFPSEYTRQYESFLPESGTAVYKSNVVNHRSYQVSVTRLLDYFGTPGDLLSTALNMLIQDINNGKLKEKKNIVFNNYPAVSFVILSDNSITVKGVMLLAGKALYTLSVICGTEDAEEYAYFLNSFKLLKENKLS